MSRTLTAKQQFWSRHLQQADAFDGSMADYARQQDLPVQSLYQWRNTLRKREITQVATQSVFTEITQTTLAAPSLTLYLGKAQLVFAGLPDPAWLSRVITGE